MRPRYLGGVHNEEDQEHASIGNPRTDYFGDNIPWSGEMLLRVVKGLFVTAGNLVVGEVDREIEDLLRSSSLDEMTKARLKKGKQLGEGGMYI